MNKFSLYFILPVLTIVLFSCSKDDDKKLAPPRDFAVQYPSELDSIENYLKTHSFTVVENDGRQDVKIDTFIVGNPEGKVSIWNNTEYPLQFKMVKNDVRVTNLVDGRIKDPVDYKMYYFIVNEGGGESTTTFDSTYVSYRGWRLNNKQVDISNTPSWATFPTLSQNETSLISGFRQFLPMLKAAVKPYETSESGEVIFNNSGVGVVFIPSGLGYYSGPRLNIPAYSPLVFTVRLHSVRERDHDRDGILSKFENGAGVDDLFTVDTDGDNIPDFLDLDDDGDGVRTKLEIKNPANGLSYPFNEIPTCPGGTLKKHLDPSCQ